jgi:hypothetical protein
MSVDSRSAAGAEDVFEDQRREVQQADKYSKYVTTISALVVLAGSAVLLFG